MDFQPLYDRVLVKPFKEEEKVGSIIIPEGSKGSKPGHQRHATVLAVGPGAPTDSGERLPMDVKVGDEVVIANVRSAFDLRIEGKDCISLPVSDIEGIARRHNG